MSLRGEKSSRSKRTVIIISILIWIFPISVNIDLNTCLAKTAMSSLKDSEEQTSPPAIPGSLGVQVANSHFSNISASNGKSGWLEEKTIQC